MKKDPHLLCIGILGCGPIAQFAHLEACQKAQNAELYAICDVAQDLLDRLAPFYQPRQTYTSYEEMLNDPQLEAVIIATSDAFHVEASRMAIQAGKHVLVEKPLAIDLESGLGLLKEVKSTDLLLQVGHMKRFDPGVAFARDFIDTDLGEIVAYKGWYCDASTRYDATDSLHPVVIHSENARKPAENPKADLKRYYMLAHGSHLVDTARFLVGEILSVKAKLVQKAGMYNWFIDTEFANGCNGHLDLTVAIKGDWHEGFHIYGTGGSVFGKIYNPWYQMPGEVKAYSEKSGQYSQVLDNKANTYMLQLEAFADQILHGKNNPATDIHEGLESVKTMLAIARSVESGERVKLSEVSGEV